MIGRTAAALFSTAAAFLTLDPLLVTHLKPVTLQEFDDYAQQVKSDAERRIRATPVDFVIAESPGVMDELVKGKCIVRPNSKQNPVPITDGLIHDWTGDIFIPQASVRDVLNPLQDFDRHARIYPAIMKARLLSRNGNHLAGYWRLAHDTNPVKVTLDVYDDADYSSPAPGKWLCVAHTPKILQVEDAGTPEEKELPDGEGYGFLWRLNAYWLLAERDGGVLAECRTLSLSRGIPAAVAWLIKPYVESQPREALQSTLECTRNAVRHPAGRR